MNRITELTKEQEALIPVYRDKWQHIACSTAKNNEQLATEYIKKAYEYLSLKESKVMFFDSPYAAQNYAIKHKLKAHLRRQIEEKIYEHIKFIDSEDDFKIEPIVFSTIKDKFSHNNEIYFNWNRSNLYSPVRNKIKQEFQQFIKCIRGEKHIVNASIADYLLSVLNYSHNKELLETFVGLVKHCGWLYPYRNLCLVVRSPVSLYLNDDLELHAIGKRAIAFADGFACYAYEGTLLPDKYGTLHPNK